MRLLYFVVPLAGCVPAIGRRLTAGGHPRWGAWILAALCAVVGLASVWAYALFAGTLFEDLAGVENAGDVEPVSDVEGMVGLILVCAAVARLLAVEFAWLRLRRRLGAACPPVRDAADDSLVILADAEPFAFALGGRRRRVVITQGMLRALSASQRRVLLAHERAHLVHGHHRLAAAARFAAAVNPLLRPARSTVEFLCERWADEVAAAEVGDRTLAARSLSTAAVAGRGDVRTAGAAFIKVGVVQRVAALLQPEPSLATHATVIALGVVAAVVALDSEATVAFVTFVSQVLP